jgi:hypothetical protein
VVILPGVVMHAANVVEHSGLVAYRIVRFAEAAGRENVTASIGCGLGGRVHPQVAWAKPDTLVKGAELATGQLWGKSTAVRSGYGTRGPRRDRAGHAGRPSPGACAPSRPGERLAHDRTFAVH